MWLGNNPNSRTALRENIDRAEKEVRSLEKMVDKVKVIDLHKECPTKACGKCSGQEAPTAQEIRGKIRFRQDNEALKTTKWPEEAFERTKVVRGDPVELKEENIIFWLGADPHQNKNLIKMARTKFHQVDEVIENGKIHEDFQFIEVAVISRTIPIHLLVEEREKTWEKSKEEKIEANMIQ